MLGKAYESLIEERLEKKVDVGRGLSANQFGFHKGRSTITAVEKIISKLNAKFKLLAMVTIDIHNG